MDKIKEQVIDSCVTELCKKSNKEKLEKRLLEPLLRHVFDRFKYVLYIMLCIIVLTYMKITFILIKIKKLKTN